MSSCVWTAVDRNPGTFAGIYVGDGSAASPKGFLKELRIRYTVDVVCTDGNYSYENVSKKLLKAFNTSLRKLKPVLLSLSILF